MNGVEIIIFFLSKMYIETEREREESRKVGRITSPIRQKRRCVTT